ncbi:MAG: S-layer protein [Candidatus Aenigmatarchaeota archaeon]
MQIKKWVATGLSALMAGATLAGAVLAAPLSNYPAFFGGEVPYVVIGATAASSDVVGAVDIMASLAGVSVVEKTVPGVPTTQVLGIERKVVIPTTNAGSVIASTTPNANQFPIPLKTYHFSGLLQGQFSYKGTSYNYHEEVNFGTTNPILTHSLTTYVNGTLKMKVDTNAVEYRYVFDNTIPASDFNFQTANTTSYQNPVSVKVAGKDFLIVAVPSSSSFVALTGTVGWVTAGSTTGLTVGDLTALVDAVYQNTQASIRIVDKDGNLVANLGVVGTDARSFTFGGKTYKIKVLNTALSTKESVADSAQLVFGEGDVEKTYDGSDTAVIADWGPQWKISGNFPTAGQIQAGNYIKVVYSPATLDEAQKYYEAGSKFLGPGGYFELSYAGLTPDKFAKVTIAPVSGKTVYNSTAASGYSTWSGLNGLEFSTDVGGTIVYGGVGYDKTYLLFNASDSASLFNGTFYWLGYFDKNTNRIVNLTAPEKINDTTYRTFKFDLSYGGSAAVTYSVWGEFDGSTLLNNLTINSSTSAEVVLAYRNRTASSTTASPELVLGPTAAKSESNDVRATVEGSLSDISLQEKDVLTDNGVIVYTVKGNADADKAVVGIPPETVYGLVQFGKVVATTGAGQTYKEFVPVTAAVAKLDSELTTAADRGAKHLILVGGPCVNTLVADLATAGKFPYTCATWPGRDFGMIKVIDDAFATGKIAVVVAGTRAADTRLAASVLQQYATRLAGVAASTVEVTGTTAAPVVTPV